jgi:hypothetical protein
MWSKPALVSVALNLDLAILTKRCIHKQTFIHKLNFRGSRGMKTPWVSPPAEGPGTRERVVVVNHKHPKIK